MSVTSVNKEKEKSLTTEQICHYMPKVVRLIASSSEN